MNGVCGRGRREATDIASETYKNRIWNSKYVIVSYVCCYLISKQLSRIEYRVA